MDIAAAPPCATARSRRQPPTAVVAVVQSGFRASRRPAKGFNLCRSQLVPSCVEVPALEAPTVQSRVAGNSTPTDHVIRCRQSIYATVNVISSVRRFFSLCESNTPRVCG
ncbi:hypothetical protein EVAR_28_1 [Eumeta japonica]|uniref:Uncharacterized protein n=1 Tax=Eumeta variegata TaxID=151549 RepID=A0A4C1S8T8_EUMVA|nr:hypothetical protein EVAR_28_1 [Eumeta japonica]